MSVRRHEARNSGAADVEDLGHLSLGLVALEHFQGGLALLGVELGLAPTLAPLFARRLQASLGSGADHLALELSKGPQHLHHHTTSGVGGVDLLGEALESGLGLVNALDDEQQILQ